MFLFFYFFAILITVSALMVVASRNPVHSVLWLIFAFCNGAGLMVLIGAQYLAMMLIIIYVGAVAVLFLFVVMMLDIKITDIKQSFMAEKGFAMLMAILLFVDLAIIIGLSQKNIILTAHIINSNTVGSVKAIGGLLYTKYILVFQTSGMILFVAMIASIALTLRQRPGVRRQKVLQQLGRNKENSLAVAERDGQFGLDNLRYDD